AVPFLAFPDLEDRPADHQAVPPGCDMWVGVVERDVFGSYHARPNGIGGRYSPKPALAGGTPPPGGWVFDCRFPSFEATRKRLRPFVGEGNFEDERPSLQRLDGRSLDAEIVSPPLAGRDRAASSQGGAGQPRGPGEAGADTCWGN